MKLLYLAVIAAASVVGFLADWAKDWAAEQLKGDGKEKEDG